MFKRSEGVTRGFVFRPNPLAIAILFLKEKNKTKNTLQLLCSYMPSGSILIGQPAPSQSDSLEVTFCLVKVTLQNEVLSLVTHGSKFFFGRRYLVQNFAGKVITKFFE